MAQYRYRRRRRGRRILPVLFVMMVITAAVLILGRAGAWNPETLLVIRDSDGPDTYYPAQTDEQTADDVPVPPDVVISPSENGAGRRTSFHLDAEAGEIPVETLPSLNSDGTETGESEPEKPRGMASRIPADYDYSSPVPEAEPVEWQYLMDSVLIGDSRMQGLILYCGLSRITSYTYKGLTVDSVFTKPVIAWEQDENTAEEDRVPEELYADGKIPVMEALKRTSYNKVYIMLGINETGWPDPAYFPEAYGKIIDAVREDNPDALIYVLSVFPVTQAVSDTHDYVTNEKIGLYNDYLRSMTEDKKVFFVDLAPAVVNDDGVLPADSGVDGIHLNKTYCLKVLDYILAHTVPLD